MVEKRILFTGGGSAGHVIVNLALIPYFQREGWQIDYIGSYDGIERKLIEPLEKVTYHPISTGKLRRYMSIENLKDPFKVLKGTFQAWNVMRKRKPQIIFSKGGFVSVPVVVAAKMRRIPTIIHESDLTPGLANKIAMPFAQKILTTFPETNQYIKKEKGVHIGAVIRDELLTGSAKRGFEQTGLHRQKPVILIMGGSIGSKNINAAVREHLDLLLASYQLIHICGEGNIDRTINRPGYVQYEYVSEGLNDIFAITDYVISRAGSNAIFEFVALRLPMLLVPLPLSASRGDQIDNAKSFVKSGFAHVLHEEDITAETLIQAIDELVNAAPKIQIQLEKYDSKEAQQNVIKLIEELRKK